jgi:hypothetical protein
VDSLKRLKWKARPLCEWDWVGLTIDDCRLLIVDLILEIRCGKSEIQAQQSSIGHHKGHGACKAPPRKEAGLCGARLCG